jgi:uncharacterized membrane protein
VERRGTPRGAAVAEHDAQLVTISEAVRGQKRRVAATVARTTSRGPCEHADRRRGAGQVCELVHVVLEELVRRQLEQLVEAVLARVVGRRQHGARVEAQPARGFKRHESGERTIGRLEVRRQAEAALEDAYELESLVLDRRRHRAIVPGRTGCGNSAIPDSWDRPGTRRPYRGAMDWVVVGVQWMHVLLGILWFGTVLSLDVIVIPAINRLPIVAQRDVSSAIAARATPLFHVVVPTIIILGMIRGTLLGPIRSVDALLGTAYGLTWLVALAATVGTYLWGLLVLVPAIRAMDAARSPRTERAPRRWWRRRIGSRD